MGATMACRMSPSCGNSTARMTGAASFFDGRAKKNRTRMTRKVRATTGRKGEVAPMFRTLLAAALVAGCALTAAAPADAQTWPSRPIKVVVPFPPGGPTDGLARIISDRLSAVLGQPIVVENRGGAGGGIGGKFVAESEPDGYTILMSPGGSLTSGPVINPKIGYDPAKVFAPV